ncbi:MAG: sulfatase-like hydrolase/transferase [Kiritimatiellae bacterium]|nr:sulfatase-like hydrolase/transferase [Kiritimatiellia bacterium]
MPDTDKPNIIMFFTDQQRWDSCGCYGQTLDVTPNLDRMAAEGVRFNQAFTCQPVCGPARACLQTGKYATEVGCWRNGIALPLEEKTLAHRFSEAGYEVGYIGKWHLASTHGLGPEQDINLRTEPVPLERRGGYADYWLAADVLEFTSHGYEGGYMFDKDMNKIEFGGYRVDSQTDFVLQYIRARDGKKPFFLFLSYLEPHHQNDRNRYEGPEGSKERFKEYQVPGDLVDTEGDWRAQYADYLGCCWSLDRNLGRIRDELARLGMAKNTLILYTSDHGSHFRTRNSEYKRSCHDGCIHIPMIAWGPGFPGGTVIEELVSLIDVPPTLLQAGGIHTPATMRGRPLQQLVTGPVPDWPDHVFLEISESHVGRAVRTKKWKYSVRAPQKHGGKDSGSELYVEDFLYDLEQDPHERDNLVREPALAGVRGELAGLLKRRMAEIGSPEPEIRPAETT